MKTNKILILFFILLIQPLFVSGQCNTNTSICTPGTAGPFNFVTPGTAVSTCLDWIGPNTGYIILHITSSGPLNMLIDGNSASGFLDVAVFNIPPGQSPCTAITNTANQIGCNYASASSGCNQFGTTFPCASSVPAPNVTAGQEIMIIVENWSGSSSNFTMQLGPPPGAQTGPPNPAITPVGPFCTTSPSVQLIAADMGGTWSGPGVSSTGLFNPATAGLGTHTINYTIGVAPCNAASSTTITVNNASISVSSPNTNICSGSSTTLNAAGASSYTWSPAGSLSASTGASVTASPTTTTTYSVTGTTAGCTNTQNITITVKPNPTVNAVTNKVFCHNANAPITAFSSPNAGASFTWTNSNTAIGLAANGTGNLPAFTATNTGTTPIVATISVTATLNGCTGPPITFTITVNPSPSTNANPDISVCNGANVSATTFTSNPAGATFTWTNSNTAIGLGANGTGNQPTFVGTNAGAAPIFGNITVTPTLNGCVGTTDVYQITINTTPSMNVPTDITQCGGTVSPAAFVSNPAGATFNWTNSNTAIGLGANGTGSISSFTGTNSGAVPITGNVTITPSFGTCVGASVNFDITINPTPVITAIADIVDCENVNIPSTVVSVTPAGANVTWTNTNTGIGLAANGVGNIPTFLSTNATTGAITGTITVNASANGCNAVAETFDITINQLPTVDPVTAITQCSNTTVNSVVFTSTTPGVTFDWTNSNTSIGLGASGTGALPSFTATNATTAQTSGTITVTPTLGTCVGSPITFAINVNPVPVPTAQNNGPLCPGDAFNLTSTGLPGSTYSWTGPNGFVSGNQNPTIASVTAADAGLYTVTVSLAGCTGTATTTLTMNPSQVPTITQVGPFCINDPVVLLQASVAGGTWSGNGIVNPVTGQFAPSSAVSGNNVITYTVIGACAVPATTTIVINPLPTVQFTAPDLSGCTPFTAVFTDNSVPASSSVSWDFGDGTNSTQTGTVSHVYNGTGCFDVSLTTTSAEGCSSSLTLNNYICVNPYADASFTVDNPTHSIINPEFQTFNSSTDATIYSWTFGDGTTSSATNPTHEYPSEPGTYTIMLAANNANNCPDTAYLTVVIEDQLIFHVPNSFTPDGDEFNNMFEPIFYSGFDPQSYTLLIYDRWGEVLFESHNVEQGWNGTYHDGIVKEGTYTWTIQFKDSMSDKKRTYNGNVTLLK
ncbi:MAG: gliding motility-associated C-terminal domain-containing protein [Fluviicola sp.]|nr:gliding motility-associated C-terminal domain-containing protein [Fluviicola sp.]